jgi:siderophore synthetase component
VVEIMKLEVKDLIGAKKSVVFVVNRNGAVYQLHKLTSTNKKSIEIKEDDIVVEYALKYDFKENKLRHMMCVIYYPKTMSEEEAFNIAKSAVAKYLDKQIKMGVNLTSILGR